MRQPEHGVPDGRPNARQATSANMQGMPTVIRYLRSSRPTVAKWCLIALVLLAPGAVFVLPILWLARRYRGRRGAPPAAGRSPAGPAPDVTREPSAASG